MRVAVLGPLEVHTGEAPDGVAVVIGPAKERAVLTLLALHNGTELTTDQLIEALWGEDPPRSARKAVQTYIASLRRQLPAGTISTTSAGYLLRADAVDAARFEDLIVRSRQLAGAGDTVAAAGALSAALRLWRGPPLPDLSDQHLGAVEAVRLDELRRAAEEDLVDLRLAVGGHAELVAELEAAVAAEPLRERRWGQLMLALYRCGRQADALRAYQRVRRHLAEDLGLEPGTELAQLEEAILAQRPGLGWTGPGGGDRRPLPEGGPAPARRLPVAANSFIGRDGECDAVAVLMARARLVTITGPGGCGKTRLALEVANRHLDRYADGLALVSLSPVQADGVVGQAAAAVGVDQEPERPLIETLVAALAERRLLVVLDNCEHVLDNAALLAEALVTSRPRVSVLATSREALRCRSEHRFTLEPLSHAAAIELFTERAMAATATTGVHTADRQLVEQICRRLDHLPLALEIAAARLEAFTPAELAAGLDDRFALLSRASRAVEDRHRTLRAAIDWSYRLLDEAEQRLFKKFGVFVGGATYEGLRALSGAADASGLVEKSLVVRVEQAGHSRLSMHETVRHYAIDLLEDSGEAPTARREHAGVYLSLAEQAAPRIRGPRQREWIARLDAERDNMAAAITWAIGIRADAVVQRFAKALWWYWFRSGQAATGRAWLEAGLPRSGHEVDGEALGAAGYLAWVTDDFVAATAYAERALAGPDPRRPARALALGVLTRVQGDRDDFGSACRSALESERLYQEEGDPWLIAWARRCRATATFYGGDPDAARVLVTDAAQRFRDAGDEWAVAGCLDLLATMAMRAGDVRSAIDLAQKSVSCHREFEDSAGTRVSLLHLAEAARLAGDLDTARRAATESLELSREHGYRIGALHAHLLLAALAADAGDSGLVTAHAREGAALARQLDDSQGISAAAALLEQWATEAAPSARRRPGGLDPGLTGP